MKRGFHGRSIVAFRIILGAVLAIAALLAMFGMAPLPATAEQLAQSAPAKQHIAIVFLHGRLGTPDYLAPLAAGLRTEGYVVEIPAMSWSRTRVFDATVEESMAEIDAIVAGLRAKGARRIYIGGHSLGGAATLRYAATRQKIDGLILVAASWNTASPGWQRIVGASVARAREAVAAGRDRETAPYEYVTNDGKSATVNAHGRGYLDFNRPHSPISIPANSGGVARALPVLWLSASEDSRYTREIAARAFASLPAHPASRHDTFATSHSGAANAALPQIVAWMELVGK